MKIQSTLLGAAIVALLLTGCSPARLLAVAGNNNSFELIRDISYGDNPRHKMDIFQPYKQAASRCAILFFYGGSWQNGERANYHFAAQGLTRSGCVVAVADYRLYPEVSYPVFIEDGAKAFVWLQNNAKTYNINTNNLYIAGHSAGAYNAAMLAVKGDLLQSLGATQQDIRGVIGLAGPYDFLPFTDKEIIALFSTAPDEQTQPVNHVNGKTPPFLLLTGGDDTTVLPKNTDSLAKTLVQQGNRVRTKTYPDIGHVGIALALSPVFAGKAPVITDITQFIRDTEGN